MIGLGTMMLVLISQSIWHGEDSTLMTGKRACQCVNISGNVAIGKKVRKHHRFTDIGIQLEQKYNIQTSDSFMFPLMINNPELCLGDDDIHHVILVVSAPSHIASRDALRKTWTQNNLLQRFPSRTIFVFGNTYNDDTQRQLEKESRHYKDIIQANFEESYHNLTLKVLVGIKWVMTYCSDAQYILRTNDDVMIDMITFVKVLTNKFKHTKRSLMGLLIQNEIIGRKPRPCGKFCVAKYDHGHYKYYPIFLQGSFYVLTRDIIEDLYVVALRCTYFWIEDAYLTGFLVQTMINVNLVDLGSYFQFHERKFMQQYLTASVEKPYFMTSTSTFYGPWAASLLYLSKEDKMLIGDNTRFLHISNRFTRKTPS